eukprot:TRINITY_DN27649_c0_g1_i1.p1 TRINITY_DN27649_c0_g1~~TRINITY_DN27649_c0_g1_i1.p1  ORF type:complete len:124 (-),score=20.74 TRINITY_DN27649_c0_g1_i1:158-508(-)
MLEVRDCNSSLNQEGEKISSLLSKPVEKNRQEVDEITNKENTEPPSSHICRLLKELDRSNQEHRAREKRLLDLMLESESRAERFRIEAESLRLRNKELEAEIIQLKSAKNLKNSDN